MKYVQFAIFTFPLFNNRKGFAGLLLIFAFLIKILKGVLGELNQQKKEEEKNLICIPQALLMEETCCLFKSIFWWERPSSRVPEPSSDSFSWLCSLLHCLQSSEFLVLSFLLKMELGCMPRCRAARKANMMKCPSTVFCTHDFTSPLISPRGSPPLADEDNEACSLYFLGLKGKDS